MAKQATTQTIKRTVSTEVNRLVMEVMDFQTKDGPEPKESVSSFWTILAMELVKANALPNGFTLHKDGELSIDPNTGLISVIPVDEAHDEQDLGDIMALLGGMDDAREEANVA